MFLTVVTGVFAVLHLYVGSRLSANLALAGATRLLTFAALTGLFLLLMATFTLAWNLPRSAAMPLRWAGFTWMGTVMLLAVALFAGDLVQLLVRALPPVIDDPARRVFLRNTVGFAALAATGAMTFQALREGMGAVAVKEVSVRLKRLPKEIEGLRIVQISDLHIGPMLDGAWLRRVVDEVNALSADLVVITGDLVDGTVGQLKDQIQPIAELKSRYGVFYVTGNHEYMYGADRWASHLRDIGVRVLRNARETVRVGPAGLPIDLAGVEDFRSARYFGSGPDLSKALAGRDPSRPVILLAHQPAAVEEAAALGVDLQLSGHTHGGQIWPFGLLVRLQQPYISGLHTHPGSDTQVYVSCGTGYWGPPMRLAAPAEITHITLLAG